MAILPIVELPNAILRRVAPPVQQSTPSVRALVQDMIETLDHSGGIGLSAPQVARSLRILVAKLADGEFNVFINPMIVGKAKYGLVQESCLSIPGVAGNVRRAIEIKMEFQDVEGNCLERCLTGMDAVCVQHEIDHLDGILFIDRLSAFKKFRMRLSQSERQWLPEIQDLNRGDLVS